MISPVARKLIRVKSFSDLELAINSFKVFAGNGLVALIGAQGVWRDFMFGSYIISCKISPRKVFGLHLGTKMRVWVNGDPLSAGGLQSLFD
jgi:hypothetical protein